MKKKTKRRPAGIKVELQIAGELWRQVPTLETAGPEDRVFVTSTNPNGTTTVLFGDGTNGARLPTGTNNIAATYRPSKRFTAVVMQQGRVILDKDWGEAGQVPGRYFGLYRGFVANNVDPLSQRRVRVQVPAVFGDSALWAVPCGAAGAAATPTIGSTVWVAFEAGDPSLPVWLGVAT